MNHHTIKFSFKLGSVVKRILSYTVDTDKQVTIKPVLLTIIESDDVGKVIMSEILHVYVKYIIIGTEYYVNVTDPSDFTFRNKFEPLVVNKLSLKLKVNILVEIGDHRIKFYANLLLLNEKIVFNGNYLYLWVLVDNKR